MRIFLNKTIVKYILMIIFLRKTIMKYILMIIFLRKTIMKNIRMIIFLRTVFSVLRLQNVISLFLSRHHACITQLEPHFHHCRQVHARRRTKTKTMNYDLAV